jgi:type I restriction enzyme S subunit
VAVIVAGQSPRGDFILDSPGKFPFHQGVRDFGRRFPSNRTYCDDPPRLAQAGDVLVSVRAPVGRVNIATGPTGIGRGLMAVRGGELLDTNFLSYFLESMADRWGEYESSGSLFTNLGKSQLAKVSVPLPSLAEQVRIATTLGALDDKIESNRRAIAIIEELGSALLESKLEFDEYGFPEYEKNRRLGELLTVVETGSRPKGGVGTGGHGVVSLGAESVQSAGVMSTSEFKRVPQEFADKMRRGHLEEMDVLVYKDGGKPGNFIPHVSAFGQGFPTASATINEHVYRVRSVPEISQGLLYWFLRSTWMDQEMRKRGTGVAIPGLNSSNFKDLPVPVMDRDSIEKLNPKLTPLLAKILRIASQTQILASLRETLLQELFAGRLRVANLNQVTA